MELMLGIHLQYTYKSYMHTIYYYEVKMEYLVLWKIFFYGFHNFHIYITYTGKYLPNLETKISESNNFLFMRDGYLFKFRIPVGPSVDWPTMRRAADRSGMIRYWRVLVDSLTWPGMSLSFVKIHILLSYSQLITQSLVVVRLSECLPTDRACLVFLSVLG